MLRLLADYKKGGTARVIYDEPLIGEKIPPAQLIESLDELTDNTRQELLISRPYFIPDTEMGLIIDSTNLAAGVVAEFEEELRPENS